MGLTASVAILIMGLLLAIFAMSELAGVSPIPLSGFNKRWPPIDEDEFLRRCGPNVNRSIALRTRAIIAEQLGYPYDQIYPEQNFVEDLGCD